MKCLSCQVAWFDPKNTFKAEICPFCQAVLPKKCEIKQMHDIQGFNIENGVLVKYHGDAIDVTIPDCVETIGYGAFSFHRNIKSIVIPAPVTQIEPWTFYECSGLTSISLPTSITDIGNSAFLRCVNLSTVSFPTSIVNIGGQAFSHCKSLSTDTTDKIRSINPNAL